jgi:hypothetical protein
VPDKSFDESIKAVEAAAIPVVTPADPGATLGTIISALSDKPDKWTVALEPKDGLDSVAELTRMRRLLWKSHKTQHGEAGTGPPKTMSPMEAEAALYLASTLVHWFASGIVAQNRRRT